MERWYLRITGKFLFWTFRRWEIRSFFKSKSWWKDGIYWLLESSCFELFGDGKYGLFSSQKVDRKMIFTDYWKVLVLNFSEMRNTVFFRAKKLMERWYLLTTGKFLFWTFRWWKIRSFLQRKSWWKGEFYLVFLSFPWYSRIWEIWFFVQCQFLFNSLLSRKNEEEKTPWENGFHFQKG